MSNHTPHVFAAVGVTLPFSTVTTTLRLIARSITTAPYGMDDVFAVVGLLSAVAKSTVALTWAIDYGLGRTSQEAAQRSGLTTTDIEEKAWFLLFLGSLTYTFGLAFCKFAILGFYWRLFKYTRIRLAIQIVSAVTLAWFVVRLFLVNLQCIPIQAMWDASITDKTCKVDANTFFFSTVLTHILIEIAILILPAYEVSKMHLPRGQKIMVIMLFMFGIVVCLLSVWVLVLSAKFQSHTGDLGLEMYVHTSVATAEENLAVVSASLPMLRPIYRWLLPGSLLTSYSEEQSPPSDTIGFKSLGLTSLGRNRTNDEDQESSGQLADPERGSLGLEIIRSGDGARDASVTISRPKGSKLSLTH